MELESLETSVSLVVVLPSLDEKPYKVNDVIAFCCFSFLLSRGLEQVDHARARSRAHDGR